MLKEIILSFGNERIRKVVIPFNKMVAEPRIASIGYGKEFYYRGKYKHNTYCNDFKLVLDKKMLQDRQVKKIIENKDLKTITVNYDSGESTTYILPWKDKNSNTNDYEIINNNLFTIELSINSSYYN